MEDDGSSPAHYASLLSGWWPWNGGLWLLGHIGYRMVNWLQGRVELDWSFGFMLLAFILGMACTTLSSQYPKRKEDFLLLGFILTGLVGPYLILGNPDIIFQHRAFGMYGIAWRGLLPSFYTTLQNYIFAAVVLLVNEIWATRQCFAEGGTEMPIRVALVLLSLNVAFAFFYKKLHMKWKIVCSTQLELSEEKKAQEALLSMLCSSCAHIGRDGKTIIRSSAQLDEMMGQSVKNEKLTCFLANDTVELARVEDAFSRAQVAPVTLPMTLFSARGIHKLDVFIVRRRTSEPSGEIMELGFMVGFRFSEDYKENLIHAPEFQGTFHMEAFDVNKNPIDVSAVSDLDLNTFAEPVLRYSHVAEKLSPESGLPGSKNVSGQQPAIAWCGNSAKPKPLTDVSCGDCVLCYDNVARGMAFAKVTDVESSPSEWVNVGFADGSFIRVRKDHPVGIQEIEDCSSPMQSNRRCEQAANLQPGQHTLLVVKILPLVVTSVDRNPIMPGVSTGEPCFAMSVEHPERYEPLVASSDKDGVIGQPIAISSYDRWIDRLNMNTKNTFLCFKDNHKTQGSRSVCSAPPSFAGGANHVFGMREIGKNSGKLGSDCGLNAAGSDAASMASCSGHGAVSIGSGEDLELDAVMSSEASCSSGGMNIKVGASASQVRLTELLALKSSRSASFGSICLNHTTCRPCAFHFTYCRFPDRRQPCKPSYLCEYCHDDVHNEQWRSKLRKCRPAQPVTFA